jgi:hypothetical protein
MASAAGGPLKDMGETDSSLLSPPSSPHHPCTAHSPMAMAQSFWGCFACYAHSVAPSLLPFFEVFCWSFRCFFGFFLFLAFVLCTHLVCQCRIG